MKAALEAFETLRPPAHFQPFPFDATSLKSVLHPSSEFARQRLAVRSETTDRISAYLDRNSARPAPRHVSNQFPPDGTSGCVSAPKRVAFSASRLACIASDPLGSRLYTGMKTGEPNDESDSSFWHPRKTIKGIDHSGLVVDLVRLPPIGGESVRPRSNKESLISQGRFESKERSGSHRKSR
jgi:hypothetical protein